MKLEKQFESKENNLYFLDGTQVNVRECSAISAAEFNNGKIPSQNFFALVLNWTQIGCSEETYNEEFLALLRDNLKLLEEKKYFVFIIPEADSAISTEQEKEDFIASCKHCARRIKDCISVAGFAVPQEVSAQNFMEELSAKHKHYTFFSKNSDLLQNGEIVAF